MAFLSSKKSDPAPHRIAAASRPLSNAMKSVLSADMEIAGDVRSQGEIEVNGVVDGDITCQALTIGKEAKIHGTVIAESVQVMGTLDGHIRAETVSLLGSAHVTGEILHGSLSVEAGAFIEGSAKRIGSDDKSNGKVTPIKSAPAQGPVKDDKGSAAPNHASAAGLGSKAESTVAPGQSAGSRA